MESQHQSIFLSAEEYAVVSSGAKPKGVTVSWNLELLCFLNSVAFLVCCGFSQIQNVY